MMSSDDELRWRCPNCGKTLSLSGSELRCDGCGQTAALDAAGFWRFANGFRPTGFDPSRREHLSAIEDGHFWFPPRRDLLASLLERHGRGGQGRLGSVLELGCGTGGFLGVLGERFERVVAVDAYGESLSAAAQRDGRATLVQADVLCVPLCDHQFDLVVALDVLEHVEGLTFLREAARLARSGGRLLLSVPAFPSLWSPLDEAAGHRCRYRRRDLSRLLEDSGWRLVHHTHYQTLLFPLVWLVRRFSTPALRRAERAPSSVTAVPLGLVNRLEVKLFRDLQLPWGSSLMAVAERTEGP